MIRMHMKTTKKDFPILQRTVNGKRLVYLDNAATSQKPQQMIDAISEYYSQHNANVHRGVHQLSDESTTEYEKAHQRVAEFFGAADGEFIQTRNTTEAINAVRYGWADHVLNQGDVILLTLMEHHSNLVMWQQVSEQTGAILEFVRVTDDGLLDMEDLERKLRNNPVRLFSIVHVSNTLGTCIDLKAVSELKATHAPEAKILVDAAQSAPHIPLHFGKLQKHGGTAAQGVDFMTFSGHKMLGPMGIGGLLVRRSLLEDGEFRPWLFGGGMISDVKQQETTFHHDLCERFVAGTPDVASLVGLAAACDYLDDIGMDAVMEHDEELVAYALEKLQAEADITVVGPMDPSQRVGSVAFVHDSVHAHDVSQVLDSEGIAVRSGHHCTQPLHDAMGWQGTVRFSFQVYNSTDDIDAAVAALEKVRTVFG